MLPLLDQKKAVANTQEPSILSEDDILMLFGEARPLFMLHSAILLQLEKVDKLPQICLHLDTRFLAGSEWSWNYFYNYSLQV